jgi:fermentation-respiration switch protein FrsA (DUF1100 family)
MFLAIERRLIFQPKRADEFWKDAESDLDAADVWLSLPGGGRAHAWWCPTPGWSPGDGAVLYCHGTGGNLSHRGESVRRWRDRIGAGVLIFDYPGYGKSPGRPDEAGCYAAADAGYDWLVRECGVAPSRIVLHGGSLGGAVAVELATRRPYRTLVVLSAFTSVADMARVRFRWLPVGGLLRTRFDSLGKIGRCPGRVFVAHGTADRVIPFDMGRRLFEAARGPKQLFAMEGYDHHHTPGPEFYTTLRGFLDEHPPAAD